MNTFTYIYVYLKRHPSFPSNNLFIFRKMEAVLQHHKVFVNIKTQVLTSTQAHKTSTTTNKERFTNMSRKNTEWVNACIRSLPRNPNTSTYEHQSTTAKRYPSSHSLRLSTASSSHPSFLKSHLSPAKRGKRYQEHKERRKERRVEMEEKEKEAKRCHPPSYQPTNGGHANPQPTQHPPHHPAAERDDPLDASPEPLR